MARRRLPHQQDLLSNLLTISRVREDVELLLGHVIRLQSETVSLSVANGISQKDLADVAQLSRQRIGQLADAIDPTTLSAALLDGQIHQVDQWPQNVMNALAGTAHATESDNPERRAARRQQITVVYGEEEAIKRDASLKSARAALTSDSHRRAAHEEAARQRRRTIFGPGEGRS
jgi:hypothetical protein